MRGFSDAINRQEAASDARLLSLIVVASRGDAKDLDQTLDRLTEHANHTHGI